jgi:PAS domain S-box-containing protein
MIWPVDLFGTSGFLPRWSYGDWGYQAWLHIVADLALGGACITITLMFAYVVIGRKDVPFTRLIGLFLALVLCCGATHLIEALIFWLPIYRISGWVKLATALVAWLSVLALVRVLPRSLASPGLAQLNQLLPVKIEERQKHEQERELALAARQRSEVRLRLALEIAQMGAWELNLETQELQCSAQLARLLVPGGQAPRSLADLMPRIAVEDRPGLETVLREQEPGQTFRYQFRLIGGGDTVRWIELVGNAVASEGDRPPRLLGVACDITERKRIEEERELINHKIQEMQKLDSLGVLAGGIAHDFNNLLTGVLGNASLIRADLPANSSYQALLEQIEISALRAGDLCKQMLAYAGKGRLVVETLDLNAVIQDTLQLLRVSVSRSAVVRLNLSDDPLPIHADANQVRQVIMNLMLNSSEALEGRTGYISLTTGRLRADRRYLKQTKLPDIEEGDFAYLEVSDTGCGMDDPMLDRIFDPFFSTKFQGRGLGLAAVLGIVRSHKGTLKVISDLGKGTTFTILFPLTDQQIPARPMGLTRGALYQGEGLVLVVDDEETVRQVLSQMLPSLGHDVLLAEHGRQGLEKFGQYAGQVRLVLLDLAMPHLDGEQTFRELRKLQPDVKVVGMSGFNEKETPSRFASQGIAGFLPKPFNRTTLTAVLRSALAEDVPEELRELM